MVPKVSENKSFKGMKGTICGFKNAEISSRLMSIGVTKGCILRVIGKSPFGSSYHVLVDGRGLAMGLQEIESISLL